MILGELMEAEVAKLAGAERYEHTPERVAQRNGYRERRWDTRAGTIDLQLPKLREGIDRRRRSQSGLSRLLGKLLGLELKMRQYQQGKFFFDAIARQGGAAALTRVFSGPDALPTLAELKDPAAWLARTRPKELPQPSSA